MKPNGPAIVASVMKAVSTFGRSSAGVRMVRRPTTGALTSGTKNAKAARMRTATGHDVVGERRNSGSGSATIPKAASFSSGTFCVACCATIAPASAPTPKPAKRKPSTYAFAS